MPANVRRLTSVDGEIVHDIDPAVCPVAAGPIVIDDTLTVDASADLARSATYRAATFEERLAGAAVGIRPRLIDTREETRQRCHVELGPEIDERRFRPDPLDLDALARGVVAAAEAWVGPLERRLVAVHGFDDRARAVARAVVERGARLAGVSSEHGAIASAAGLDLDDLEALRAEHGGLFVTRVDGLDPHHADELLGLAVDVLVTAGEVGSIDDDVAARMQAGVVVPYTGVPYTAAGLHRLRAQKVVALPDFVTTAGPFLAAAASAGLPRSEILDRVERLVGERVESARLAKMDPIRYCASIAETFLTTWVPAEHRPDGPPLVRPVSW
ncbi:MAG: hypothetical protein U5K30_03800 [Acidimicrobiales bacterium]|nr:hypothetical protein [Acidimicrobiales bacterium]